MDVSPLFNPGIYKITCLKNEKIYIGESTNVLSRLGRHSDNLENNRHDCLDLQKDFNKYGKQGFLFELLEFGPELQLELTRKRKENQYINEIKTHLRYNKEQNKSWNFYSREVCIKGKIFQSLRDGFIPESRTNIARKCKDLNNLDYQFLEKTSYKRIYKKNSIFTLSL